MAAPPPRRVSGWLLMNGVDFGFTASIIKRTRMRMSTHLASLSFLPLIRATGLLFWTLRVGRITGRDYRGDL